MTGHIYTDDNRRMFFFLMVLTIISTTGFQEWRTLLNNYAVEIVDITGQEMGIIQSIREIPGFLAMLVMMFLGIPVYVCATASVPIAAVLIMKGLNPGAALVFLMTGPATNAASFTTIWKVLGKKTAVIYLLSVAGCALAAGLTIDYLANWFGSDVVTKPHFMLHGYVKTASAILLLAVLFQAIFLKSDDSESAH